MTFKQTLLCSLAAAFVVAGSAGQATARDAVIVHTMKAGPDAWAPSSPLFSG